MALRVASKTLTAERGMKLWGSIPFSAIIVAAILATAENGAACSAEKKYGPGVTDTEIKIGQTIAYSGPASSFGTVGHTILVGQANAAAAVRRRPLGRLRRHRQRLTGAY